MASNTYQSKYKKMRWFVERDRLALVELQDDRTSVETAYKNLPSGSSIRLYGAKIAQHFDPDTNTIPEIPEQYHEALVFRVIAAGYEIPPNQNMQAAMYFEAKYQKAIKDARKWKQMGRQGGTGYVVPMDF